MTNGPGTAATLNNTPPGRKSKNEPRNFRRLQFIPKRRQYWTRTLLSFEVESNGSVKTPEEAVSGPILVVEDTELHAYLLEKGLQRAGIQKPVIHYSSAIEAKEYLNGQGNFADRNLHPLPSALFLDIRLQEDNGLKILQWMKDRQLLEKIFTIVISGMNDVEVVKTAFAMGAHFFLGKPVDYNDLQTLIQNHPAHFE